MSPPSALTRDLARTVRGTVSDTPADRRALAGDFGGVYRRSPLAVVRPADTRDVAAVIRFAGGRGIPVVPRGAGHSQGGQSLAGGGISLDMRALAGVEILTAPDSGPSVLTGAGAPWGAVLRAALATGLVPPVLTSSLEPTVGGTLSVGGVGHTSHRHGTQADQVLALEVVTGSGEIVRCSEEEERDLFEAVLCGLGRCGVVTAARSRLSPLAPVVRRSLLLYHDLEALLADAGRFTDHPSVSQLLASSSLTGGRPLHRLVIKSDEAAAGGESQAELLSPGRAKVAELDTRFDARRLLLAERRAPLRSARENRLVVRPGVDLFLPGSRAGALIESVLRTLSRGEVDLQLSLLFLRSSRLGRPLLAVPAEERLVLFGVQYVVRRERAAQRLADLSRLCSAARAAGATRYLSGWHDFSPEDWRRHYGGRWEDVLAMKRRFDPGSVLPTLPDGREGMGEVAAAGRCPPRQAPVAAPRLPERL